MALSKEHEAPRRHRLTADDYHRMGEAGILPPSARVELIDGDVIDMGPIGSRHAGVVRQIARLIERAVGDAAIVSVQSPIALDEWSEPQPDIALLEPRADFYKSAHPMPKDVMVIVEVADSSPPYDRDVKLALYASHHVSEVWLVDLQHEEITRYRNPHPDGYRTTAKLFDLTNLHIAPTDAFVDLSSVFAR
ncbi:MAG TPA: Uma2 family endonuclease [Gammaproteobacteria bacterium]|nr:Uma2 family endonuclease [Gammaproteobacteria bacterium]